MATVNDQAVELFKQALRYDFGKDGYTQDSRKAFQLYQEARKLGHAGATYNLGIMYANGEGGLQKDDCQARALFGEAAKCGHAGGCLSLYKFMLKGRGGSVDRQGAYEWLKVAAKKNNGEACKLLGKVYEQGNDCVAKDLKAAYSTYLCGHLVGKDMQCAYRSAYLAIHVLRLPKEDHLRNAELKGAILALQDAAKAEIADAMWELGEAYDKGIWLYADKAKCFEWKLKAAEAGLVKAQMWVADAYECGWGVAKNIPSHRQWLLKAAQNGNMDAQFLWAQELTDSDCDKIAIKCWLMKAAEQGHHMASVLLQEIEEQMMVESKNAHHERQSQQVEAEKSASKHRSGLNSHECAVMKIGDLASAGNMDGEFEECIRSIESAVRKWLSRNRCNQVDEQRLMECIQNARYWRKVGVLFDVKFSWNGIGVWVSESLVNQFANKWGTNSATPGIKSLASRLGELSQRCGRGSEESKLFVELMTDVQDEQFWIVLQSLFNFV